MYLDETNGDVWRWSADSRSWQRSRGSLHELDAGNQHQGPERRHGRYRRYRGAGQSGRTGPCRAAGPPGASGAGTGNVVGPATSVVDDIATYNNISGTLIKDSGVKVTDLVSAATLPETIDDRVAALLVAGTNITLNYNDPANTLTINGTGSGAASGITVTPAGNIAATDVQAALVELDNEKVAKAGDTMTGPLVLPAAAPTLGPQAANKTYVDAQIAAIPVTLSDLHAGYRAGRALPTRRSGSRPIPGCCFSAGMTGRLCNGCRWATPPATPCCTPRRR